MEFVSIPFKRESVSKGKRFAGKSSRRIRFQFPSNGKAYPKLGEVVSVVDVVACFNSLQTGKRIQSVSCNLGSLRKHKMFQFPSNGKAYPKGETLVQMREGKIVSIPFKRESVSKGTDGNDTKRTIKFQFPSNGKAYPKELYKLF